MSTRNCYAGWLSSCPRKDATCALSRGSITCWGMGVSNLSVGLAPWAWERHMKGPLLRSSVSEFFRMA